MSRVEKYTISDADYDKRDDSFRNFKKRMQQQDPTFMKPESGGSEYDKFQIEEAEAVITGSRCEV